ncbi:hypothetical protein SAMN05444336_102507 [Albimonas donghaensis]|uniref:Uncharacterized protein n=1 Tax=Albimonas donghaensis TaxID=356660 RepID=A0A1H2WUW2_9RHOB|nr:hypothetical protein SAMN05444336_102507 [Albimonas donghaensis]
MPQGEMRFECAVSHAPPPGPARRRRIDVAAGASPGSGQSAGGAMTSISPSTTSGEAVLA